MILLQQANKNYARSEGKIIYLLGRWMDGKKTKSSSDFTCVIMWFNFELPHTLCNYEASLTMYMLMTMTSRHFSS